MVKDTVARFNTLQGYDTRISEIESVLANIPLMLKGKLDDLNTSTQLKETKELTYKDLKEKKLKAEATLTSQKELLSSSQKKLTSVQNNKEYEAAVRELDSLRKNIADAESKTATYTTEIESLQKDVDTLTSACEEKQTSYTTEKSEKESQNKDLFKELETLKAKRVEYAKTVKPNMLSKYERIRNARNNLAIVLMETDTCTGCYMKIPPQMAVDVKKGNDLIQCPYCQRFMYFVKDEEKKA